MNNSSLVSPSFLKQKARQIKREHSLTQSQALDEAAKEIGFINYKNYLNILEKNRKKAKLTRNDLLESIISETENSKKLGLITTFLENYEFSMNELLEILSQFQQSSELVQVICEKASLNYKIQSSLLNYFIECKTDVQALPLREHFVAKEVTVKNLIYSLNGKKIHVEGDYDIAFEFEFEVPEEHKQLPHFYRDPMFGEFEATVDVDDNVIIDDPSIGEELDNTLFVGSFKLVDK